MRKLVTDPDPRLRKICKPVEKIDSFIISLAEEMKKYLAKHSTKVKDYEIRSLGMAACQLGELISLFVIDTPQYSLVMMNPKIIKTSGSRQVVEGCLSLPGRYFIVERPKLVKFKGLDLNGTERSIKLHDELAQVAIHEMEHLGGIMVDNVAKEEITETVKA